MSTLIKLGVLVGLCALAVPWLLAFYEDTAFAGDIGHTAMHIDSITANEIATHILMLARERKIPLANEDLTVSVRGSSPALQPGYNQVTNPPPLQVTIQLRYQQPIYFGLTRSVDRTLAYSWKGFGGTSQYPAAAAEEP